MNLHFFRSFLLAIFTLLAFAGVSPSTASSVLDLESLDIPHETFELDNGLTLIVHTDHSVPIVSVNLWYHVGSGKEQRGRTGFAHLFEHFFFNGSENYPHGFREAMDDLGVNNRNGTTNTDRTNFFEDVPVSALERTLYLEADRMGFLEGNLSEEMLERERGVVQNEKRQGENRPYGQAFGRIVESIYPYSHPYSWSTIGRMEDLDAATMDDIKNWYSRFYGPNNCVLSLAGDITPERALELVTKYFGAIKPGPPANRYQHWVPKLERNIRDTMEDRVPQTRIYRVYHLPPLTSPAIPRLELAANVLSGSRSARLDRTLVYEDELVNDVAAFVWDKELASNLIIMATVKNGVDPLVVEAKIDRLLEDFLREGPTEDELQRAKARFFRGFARQMERLGGFGGRSDILAESATYWGDSAGYMNRLRSISESDSEAVRETTETWLRAHHYTLTVEPFAEHQAATEPEDLDRSVLPELGDPPAVEFPAVQRAKLTNGLEILLLERHSAPLINMTLAVDAGSAADIGSPPGTANLALQLMEEGGTTTRDAFEVIDELDRLGATVSTQSSLDLSKVRLRALPSRLSESVALFVEIVTSPAFPEEMVEIAKKRQLATIEQEKARPRTAALRILPRLLYGEGHAYAAPLTGTGDPESVESMTSEILKSWHENWFFPNNSTLIIAGDVTLDQVVPVLEETFATWQPGTAPTKNIGAAGSGKQLADIYLIDKPDAPQSVIVAAHVTHPGGQDNELALETVVRNFGRMSTSRLNRNLRLDKHWSYGAFGGVLEGRGPRLFAVIAPVQTDKTKESMIEVTREILDIAGRRPIEGDEFDSTLRNMLLRLPGRFETLESLERAAEEMVNLGYSSDYFSTYAERVRSLTETDLAAAATGFVDPEKLTWIVIGDLSRIESKIRELDYGEIRHLDTAGNLLANQ